MCIITQAKTFICKLTVVNTENYYDKNHAQELSLSLCSSLSLYIQYIHVYVTKKIKQVVGMHIDCLVYTER